MNPSHPCFAHVSAGRFAEARAVALRLPSIAEVNRSLREIQRLEVAEIRECVGDGRLAKLIGEYLDEPGREASV